MRYDKKISLTIEEKRCIQLDMLREIDDFCTKHSIRYSLAFGTLIGAIRHKGFIPWDDDVDLMMPVTDMFKFKRLFKSARYKYIDVETDAVFPYHFSRIYDTKSYSISGRYLRQKGVNIDLYPIIDIPNSEADCESYFKKARKKEIVADFLRKWYFRIARRIPISSIPLYKRSIRDYRDFYMNNVTYNETGKFFILSGPLSRKNKVIYDRDLFEHSIDVEFEGMILKSILNYDYFLKEVYGDYMKLPPIEERVPYHGGNYFMK